MTNPIQPENPEKKEIDCGKYTQTTNNIHWKLYDKYNLPKCTQTFPYLRETCFAPYKDCPLTHN